MTLHRLAWLGIGVGFVVGIAGCAAPNPTTSPHGTAPLIPTPTSAPLPSGKGAVYGGVEFCSALPPQLVNGGRHPTYVGGTVLALRGMPSYSYSGGSELVTLPTSVAASTDVADDQEFRFVLDPGRYVLEARMGGPIEPPDAMGPFTSVTVKPGVTVFAPIPNHCK